MTNAISYLSRVITTGFDYIQKCLPLPVDIMVEMPPLDANEWKVRFGLDVESPEIPQNILKALEEPCPNCLGKLKKRDSSPMPSPRHFDPRKTKSFARPEITHGSL